ncbi:hypothetical protein BCV73_32920 [Paenibacillus sp. SSG-1]|nr:hypothetical protein BCV73_32920 [Paenibacillus sp. SSG-1]
MLGGFVDPLKVRGVGGGVGISQTDLQSLIDIANTAEANNDSIKTDVVNKLKAVNPTLNISTSSTWTSIREAITGMQYNGAVTITPGASDVVIPAGYHNGSGKVSGVSVPVANVLAGTTIAGQEGTMPNKGAITLNPGSSDVAIPTGYHNGNGKVSGVPVPVANVLVGTTIAGQAGTMPNKGAVTLIPGSSDVTIPAGYHNGNGKVSAVADLIASNIIEGAKVGGVLGTAAKYKFVSGTVISSTEFKTFVRLDAGTVNHYYVQVSYAFGWSPKLILLYKTSYGSTDFKPTIYCSQDGGFISLAYDSVNMSPNAVNGAAYVNSNGFLFPVEGYYANYNWLVFG